MRPPGSPPKEASDAWLTLAALGVAFGDIGTSPLYALRECFHGWAPLELTRDNVLGVSSLIVWCLLGIISGKYLAYVMRADNAGEGGILALMAVAQGGRGPRVERAIVGLGLFGAALLFGDGMITPAISVLSAVEGLEVAAPGHHGLVLPVTVVILLALFAIQRRGTAVIGRIFGPVTLLWFVVLGALGVGGIARHPGVLAALSPLEGIAFFARNGVAGAAVLGGVFLVVTGGEALYADMGHFGRRPIRDGWLAVALPGLALHYLGQAALLLDEPEAIESPFFHLAPDWALYPLVALSTVATVVASQAVITGTFSVVRQAVMLGYAPRVAVRHTSSEEAGQVYVPAANAALLVGTIALVVGFGSSQALAGAYGIAVSLTMAITTALAFFVARDRWGWTPWAAGGLTAALLVVDLAFVGANGLKVLAGGWVPLLVAAALQTLFTTWRRGRALLTERVRASALSWPAFDRLLAEIRPAIVPGDAVYLARQVGVAPLALVDNLMHNRVLHTHNFLLTVTIEPLAHLPEAWRVTVRPVDDRFVAIEVRYGFMETPDLKALVRGPVPRLPVDPYQTTFFVGRETLLATTRPGMALWRERLFAFMARNAQWATTFLGLPPDRVLEIGRQVEL